MRIKFDYPVNGQDLDIFVEGDMDGELFDIHKLVVKFRLVEVLRVEEEQTGLLAETDMAEEIINIAKSVLHDQVSANH